jgi:purine-binding chemotaxis protein CheW
VIVDEVVEVLTVSDSQIEPVPGTGSELIEAVAKVDDRLVILLNPEELFSGLHFAG